MERIMETTFTPYASLGGGVLIGLASVMLMATLGRIFGATGIMAGLLQPSSSSDFSWRALLFLGMISGPLAVMAITGEMPEVQVPISTTMLVIGGFIVGLGVTFGSGCTSGHGVCGMARLSPRSIAATITFMIFTGLTVYVMRHVIGA
ncbi:YeeE/YedE family protein [Planktotalea sp.]|uniref:YeeE/YedE family protein n=1 Tax=Planktotalea sp. TaxID=2029877 RepID=UPI003D6A44D7